jgi:hypothetical protein
MTVKTLLAIVCMCFLAQTDAFSQKVDSLSSKADSVSKKTEKSKKKKEKNDNVAENGVVKDSARLAVEARPGIAARKSAIVPGLGQIYNKRWWKVPLVYGGFVGIGLVFEFNQRYYQTFLKEAQYRVENPGKTKNPLYAGYTNEGIISIKDAYRRNRDLSILGGVAFYAVTIIDAYVDAKFFRFDVSNDLSLKVDPMIQGGISNASAISPAIGLRLRLSL